MAYVYKRKVRLPDGSTRAAERWTMAYATPSGRVRRKVGYRGKTVSLEEARRLERGALAGDDPHRAEARRWRQMALMGHVSEFEDYLAARGTTAAYSRGVAAELLRAFKAMRAVHYGELATSGIERMLVDFVASGRSYKSHNHRLSVLGQFCDWMVERGRARTNPTRTRAGGKAIKPRRVATEPGWKGRQRRALTAEELRALLAAARERDVAELLALEPDADAWSTMRARERGVERATMYALAALCGLRRRELRLLTWGNVDLGARPPVLTVWAEQAKAGREDVVPLSQSVVAALEEWRVLWAHYHMRPPRQRDRILACVHNRVVGDLRADCTRAEIEVQTVEGRVDLHSLRHTFVSLLGRSGTAMAVTQALARHRDPQTTARVYTHIQSRDTLAAVAGLPDVWEAGKAADGRWSASGGA